MTLAQNIDAPFFSVYLLRGLKINYINYQVINATAAIVPTFVAVWWGIAVWDGDYYAYELIRALGLAESGGMVRVGFVHYNETEEVERLAQALRELAGSTAAQPVTRS